MLKRNLALSVLSVALLTAGQAHAAREDLGSYGGVPTIDEVCGVPPHLSPVKVKTYNARKYPVTRTSYSSGREGGSTTSTSWVRGPCESNEYIRGECVATKVISVYEWRDKEDGVKERFCRGDRVRVSDGSFVRTEVPMRSTGEYDFKKEKDAITGQVINDGKNLQGVASQNDPTGTNAQAQQGGGDDDESLGESAMMGLGIGMAAAGAIIAGQAMGAFGKVNDMTAMYPNHVPRNDDVFLFCAEGERFVGDLGFKYSADCTRGEEAGCRDQYRFWQYQNVCPYADKNKICWKNGNACWKGSGSPAAVKAMPARLVVPGTIATPAKNTPPTLVPYPH